MFDVEVRGGREFAALSRRLKDAGDKDLKKELNKAITGAVKPLRAEVKKGVSTYVPDAYAKELSKSLRISAGRGRVSKSGQSLSIVAKAKGKRRMRSVASIDRGRLRHPLWGNREHWFDTGVKPGFFTKPVKSNAKVIRKEILAAMRRVAGKIAR